VQKLKSPPPQRRSRWASAISSIRTNLIKKGIVFSPSSGKIAFRIPLADRYIRTHASFFFNDAARSYMTGLASRA
jgi:hypothetical protein